MKTIFNATSILSLTLTLLIIQISLSFCSEPDKFSKIKIGMIYDEVEDLLGKPNSISRGANELYYDIEEIQYDLLQRINLDTTEIIPDNNRWFVPHQVRTIGNLIYVNWIYEYSLSDTFHLLLNKFLGNRRYGNY